jgi:hypothetical protein
MFVLRVSVIISNVCFFKRHFMNSHLGSISSTFFGAKAEQLFCKSFLRLLMATAFGKNVPKYALGEKAVAKIMQ